MVKLSVIILSYNTKEITQKCIAALVNKLPVSTDFLSEVILVDNGSTDGSVTNIKGQISKVKDRGIQFKLIENRSNLGYPRGNNQGLKVAQGEYILFLNSDVIIEDVDFAKLISYLDNNSQIGVLTVKVLLRNGSIDPASHRGFPTLWNSFCYFIKLEKLFSKIPTLNTFFGGYHLVGRNLDLIHEIDSPTGAFYLVRKKIMEKTQGFDEEYFMYGEDLDLSFRIKQLGFKIVYYPFSFVLHLKRLSGLEKKDSETRYKTKQHFYTAMKIFYKKHYQKKYPKFVNSCVYIFIDLLKLL
jgi:GT2 family glycosyltransferase